MIRYFLYLWLFLIVAHSSVGQEKRVFFLPEGITSQDFEPNVVVVKVASGTDGANQRSFSPGAYSENLKKLLKAEKANQMFPGHTDVSDKPNARKSGFKHDLSNIYKVYLQDGEDVVEAINILLQHSEVLYAEPYYNIRPLHEPNDPAAHKDSGFQDHLNLIKAYDAWSITKGDTSIVIGILDTGYNPEHEDLKENIKYNHNDPINNFDDDDDGYKDNYAGWDFGNNDNKPFADKNGHGTEVTGVSSARSNNELGIAGTGYNSKFMPLKIYKSEDDTFAFGYEAIVYAADKGCKVINLSWGDYRAFSNFVQDIINYAVLEKDVVIVAAAGNTPDQLSFYPASYDYVLSVGATDINDNKATWATYSYHIDIMAPGQAVYTTKNDGSYGYSQGSSFSAPMVSGAAALIRFKFPELNALQVIERLRVTADDIYHLPYNQTFQDKLGKGRLNMHRALSDFNTPAFRMSDFRHENNFGKYAFSGDTVKIFSKFKNFLSPSTNATASITSTSPYVTIIDGTFDIGALGTLNTIENLNRPFRIKLSTNTPPGTKIPIRFVFSDGSYSDFQVHEFETTPDFLTLNNGNVALTISGNGNLGYHNDDYNLGVGFTYNNKRILELMGFMVATEPDKVYNNAINRFDTKKRSDDFKTISPIKFFNNGSSYLEARSHFEDNSAELAKQNLKIDQKLLSFKDLPDNDFLILEYRILNNSGTDISNLHSGLFADWNINNKLTNIVQWDENLSLGYIYDPSKPDLYAGIALLSPQQAGARAIKNASNIAGDISEDFIFSRTEKYMVLSSGTSDAQSPQGSGGEEVSHVTSAHIPTLPSNEDVKVAYALVAGPSLDKLKKNVEAAREKYNEHINNPPLIFTSFICEGESVIIDPVEGSNFRFYTDLGLTNLIHTGTSLTTGPIEDDTTFYMVNLDKGYAGDITQAKVLINRSVNDFSSDPEILILTQDEENTIQFNDYNANSVKWNWNFDNGYGSTIKNPKIKFSTSGTYNVKLVVENSSGCKNTVYKKIVVKKQSPDPIVSDLQICQGDVPVIQAENSNMIKAYISENAPYPIYDGPSFEPLDLTSDTTFYISNAQFDVDSPKMPVFIKVSPHKAQFELKPYNNNLNNKALFIAENQSKNSITRKWYVNNELLSEEVDLIIDINNYHELNIKLISWNPDGCEYVTEQSFIKRKSDTPVIGKVISCNGKQADIKPLNGINFYFYEDEGLTNLLYKGKSYSTNVLDRIFVTGVDNFIESDPVEILIDYQNFHPDFSLVPGILNLSFSQEVNFTDLSEGNLSWNWDFGNGSYQQVKNPVQYFDEPGEYWVTLVAENENGCIESVSKKLLVVNITQNEGIDENEPVLKIYPNPAQKALFLNLTHHENQKVNIKIVDQLNRPILNNSFIFEGENIELDLSRFATGIYHLQMETSKKLFYRKLIIEN